MTSKERVLTAVAHREPERVPVTFDAEKEVYAALYEHLGLKTKEALFDALHVDTWMILPDNFLYAAEEARKELKTTPWGYKLRQVAYSGGTYDEVCFCPLAEKDSLSDLKAHPWPSARNWGFSHFPQEARAHSDRAVIGVFTWGAYFIASYVRGLEHLLMDFAERPAYAETLIRTISDISLEALETMLGSYSDGIDIVYMADDYCSQQGPLFSPPTFRKFVLPYLRRVVDATHKRRKKFLLHCCGAVRPLLPMIIEAGGDMIEPIQVRAEGMEPARLKKDFGRELCFYGGVDLQQLLCKGTPQQVADGVRGLIDCLGRDGGYVLGPGHTYIQVDAPIKNILTMYETAYAHRRA